MCNVDVSTVGTWDSSYSLEDQPDWTMVKFCLVKCDTTYDYTRSELDTTDSFSILMNTTRGLSFYDEDNNYLTDAIYSFYNDKRSCKFGTKISSIITRDELNTIADLYYTDCSYFCALDFINSYVCSLESPFI